MHCWYIQAFNFLGRPDLSIAAKQASLLVARMHDASLRLLLNNFSRLFTGFSVMDGICVLRRVKRNFLIVFPFFSTRDLDFAGLKLMRVQLTSSSSPFWIHLLPGTDVLS